MSVIQQVYLAEAGYSIYIKGIKPDKDNECSGEITINGNPTRLERKERYHIDGSMLVTDNYHIPLGPHDRAIVQPIGMQFNGQNKKLIISRRQFNSALPN